MPFDVPHCRVTDSGIAHLFVAIDLGTACVCGRKRAGLSLHDERFEMRDVVSQPSLELGALSRAVWPPAPMTRTDWLLEIGADAIRKSRQLCRDAVTARERRALGRPRAAR